MILVLIVGMVSWSFDVGGQEGATGTAVDADDLVYFTDSNNNIIVQKASAIEGMKTAVTYPGVARVHGEELTGNNVYVSLTDYDRISSNQNAWQKSYLLKLSLLVLILIPGRPHIHSRMEKQDYRVLKILKLLILMDLSWKVLVS